MTHTALPSSGITSCALRDRGWSPFEAARFSRLPIDAQIVGMIRLDEEADLGERELLDDLEEVERQRRAE